MRVNLSSFRKLAERGDTVVEVLISIAVVSLVLGGAYVTANRSLRETRDTEERSVAIKLAEAQVEQIRYLSTVQNSPLFSGGPSSYCLMNNAVVTSAPQCIVDSTGITTTAEPKYTLSVQQSGNSFTVRVSWTKIGTDRVNNVEFKYRAYQ